MYKVAISLNAQDELEIAKFYYSSVSKKIAEKFIKNLTKAYHFLETNPFFGIRYKNYRAVSINKFPYLLFFEIDEVNKIVYILSYFQTSQILRNIHLKSNIITIEKKSSTYHHQQQ